MVRDGIYYALALAAVGALLGWLFGWGYALIPLPLAAFFLWFFRDPERAIPQEPGAIVSPADGKVTEVATVELDGRPRTRISIFLNVFNVHVNRTPIGGVVEKVEYRRGKFGNAMGQVSSEANEQNIVTVRGEGQTLVFKQIAGLLARRIVFTKTVGDTVARGERIGLIKFGSRCDVIFDAGAELRVKVGDKVAGGSSVLAIAPVAATPARGPAQTAEARR
ncbi:MAG TPA: phosphatidylserine decarboxylase [Terriglobales bacterium]|nr:phosphatidylserine decarboxylase [Terriglobales bacterium]